MGKKFNIADLIPESERVSESDHPEIRRIPWDRIRANEANFYGVKDVEDLARSIEIHGLLDPVVVMPAEDPGWYTLISGHRRHKAWGILREQDPKRWAEIPAIVREFSSAAMAELALIMANSSARVLTPWEVSRQAERVERLLYDLKEEGYEFPGRMRDQVAKACQVSSTKLARLKVIRENLTPAWTEKWEKNELAEDPAYQLARLPAEFQERLAKVLKKPTGEQISHVSEQYEKGVRWDNSKGLKCPDGTPCRHLDSFLLHDAKCYTYSRCHGKTCCLNCREAVSDYGPCQSACSKAVALRKEQKAQEEAKAAASRKREATKTQKAVTADAIRLVKALDAGDPVDDKEPIWGNWYGKLTAGDLRAMAAGTYKKWDDFRWSSSCLSPDKLDADTVRKLSTLTGASADWIMGLSEDMFPEQAAKPLTDLDGLFASVGWKSGTPLDDGRFLTVISYGENQGWNEFTADFSDGEWLVFDRPLMKGMTVLAWWPLPPVWSCGGEDDPKEDEA